MPATVGRRFFDLARAAAHHAHFDIGERLALFAFDLALERPGLLLRGHRRTADQAE